MENRLQQHGPGQVGQDVRCGCHTPPVPECALPRAQVVYPAPHDNGWPPVDISGIHRRRRVPAELMDALRWQSLAWSAPVAVEVGLLACSCLDVAPLQ